MFFLSGWLLKTFAVWFLQLQFPKHFSYQTFFSFLGCCPKNAFIKIFSGRHYPVDGSSYLVGDYFSLSNCFYLSGLLPKAFMKEFCLSLPSLPFRSSFCEIILISKWFYKNIFSWNIYLYPTVSLIFLLSIKKLYVYQRKIRLSSWFMIHIISSSALDSWLLC